MSFQNSYSIRNDGDYYYGSEIAIGLAFLILMSLICMCCDFEEPPDVYLGKFYVNIQRNSIHHSYAECRNCYREL